MSSPEFSYLFAEERQAFELLRGEIGGHMNAAMAAVALVEKTLELLAPPRVKDSSLSQRAELLLLSRLGNDLRCIVVLSGIGFPAQSVSLAAGSFETAFALAYIAGSEERSRQWVDHDEPTQAFRPVRTLVEDAIKKFQLENASEVAERHYRHYRQLCMAKHGNPIFNRQHGFSVEEDSIILALGPETAPSSVRAIQFALEHAVGHTSMALGMLASVEPAIGTSAEFARELQEINAAWQELHSNAVKRWGTGDPYPGKW